MTVRKGAGKQYPWGSGTQESRGESQSRNCSLPGHMAGPTPLGAKSMTSGKSLSDPASFPECAVTMTITLGAFTF